MTAISTATTINAALKDGTQVSISSSAINEGRWTQVQSPENDGENLLLMTPRGGQYVIPYHALADFRLKE